MRRLIPLLLCLATPLSAAEWALRPGDHPFDAKDLAALPGQVFRYYDDGESRFWANGAYAYTYSAQNGGGTAWGSYVVAEDGSVCVTFINGSSRCDLYVHDGNRTLLITEEGDRYPMRP